MTGRVVYCLGAEGFARIYGERERERIAAACGFEPEFVPSESAVDDPRLADAEIILSGWGAPVMDAAFLAAAPRVHTVLYAAGSVRGFVTDELVARGVRVSSAASGNAIPVAEFTVAAVYFALKRVWEFARMPDPAREVDKDFVAGAYRSTVGVFGLGAIGRLVCERLAVSDISLVAHDPFASDDDARALGVRLVELDELFATSDVVSIHAPLTDATRGIVDRRLLESMAHRATLVNTARGAIVRHDDLADVLAARPDLHAVLDVTDPEPLPPDSPLRSLPNVQLTPHIAGSLGPECHRLGDLMASELERALAGDPLRFEVPLDRLDIAALP